MPPVLPVSVVIPTRDRPTLVHDMVRSVLSGDRLPAEIVVADQSVGARAALPVHPEVEIVHLELTTVGVSSARNAGIEVARHDVLVFADDDMTVDPDWLGHLVDALLAAPDRTVVTGSVQPADVEGTVPSLKYRTEPEVFEGRPFLDPLFSGNMAANRAAFDEVGLFDVRLGAGCLFPAAGDNDYGLRLLEAGYRINFVPDATVRHLGGRRGKEKRALDWSYGRGQGGFYAKHLGLSDRYMLRRFARNVAERLRHPRREGIYLAGLLLGAADWRLRYRRRH